MVANTVLDALDAYCLVREAPRPLVAPTMSALTMVLKVTKGGDLGFFWFSGGILAFDCLQAFEVKEEWFVLRCLSRPISKA